MSDDSTKPKSDWEIAQAATVLPIQKIADKLGIPPESVEPFGHHKAKISMAFVQDALAGKRPSDGYFVEFWRLLGEYPEIILWDRLFDEGKHQMLAEVNAARALR